MICKIIYLDPFRHDMKQKSVFLECYPSFDKTSIHHFIYEREYYFKSCLNSQYEGLLTYKSWNLGKLQKRYCNAISITKRRMSYEQVLGAIISTFKISI